jgi:hypothetical protein
VYLAYTFNEISKYKFAPLFFIVFFIAQTLYSTNKDFTYNGLRKKYITGIRTDNTISFNEFYSENLFNEIKENTGKPVNTYRGAALGFHPSVLLYNGFYTIDGYNGNYDVRYKHLFGTLIREELDKNESLQIYFDTWGGRCYLFDNEIGKFSAYKTEKTKTSSLDIRYDILKEQMNCQYIISSVQIENPGEHLELQKIFENDVWKIYLYKVI